MNVTESLIGNPAVAAAMETCPEPVSHDEPRPPKHVVGHHTGRIVSAGSLRRRARDAKRTMTPPVCACCGGIPILNTDPPHLCKNCMLDLFTDDTYHCEESGGSEWLEEEAPTS